MQSARTKITAIQMVLPVTCLILSVSCASTQTNARRNTELHQSSNGFSQVVLCGEKGASKLNLDPTKPITVLVHGCYASKGQFSVLSDVFGERGQQTVCFTYDDQESLDIVASQLSEALTELLARTDTKSITVIGHSQGGLISRRALTENHAQKLEADPNAKIRLVTISSPFGGIETASHCGLKALHIASFGITYMVCKAVAGEKWHEIAPNAGFITKPGMLVKNVQSHLKLVTDEKNICRKWKNKNVCLQDDYVFSLDEQYQPIVDEDNRVLNFVLTEGHAHVVGLAGKPPLTLIKTLQENKILLKNEFIQPAVYERVLKKFYLAFQAVQNQ